MEIFLAKYCANLNCVFSSLKLEIFSPSFRQSPKISHLHGFLTKQSPFGQEEKLFFCFRKLGWRVGLQCVTGILVSLFFFGMFYRWPVFVIVSWCICFTGGLSLCLGVFVPFFPLVPMSLSFYIFVSLCLCVLLSLCSRSPVKLQCFQICLTLSSATKSNLAP